MLDLFFLILFLKFNFGSKPRRILGFDIPALLS